MRSFVLFVLIISLALSVNAQVNFRVTLSAKHQKKIERAKDARQKLKRYKKLYNKEEKRLAKIREDSIRKARINVDSLIIVSVLPDSASREDSIEWALNTLAQYHEYDEITGLYEQLSALDSSRFHPNLDSTIIEDAVRDIAQEFLPQELQGMKPDEPVTALTKGLPTDPSLSPKEQVEAFQSKMEDRTLQEVGRLMSRYKSKYVSLPDLSKPSEGVKRRSLQGSPLKNRFYLGGNVTVQATDPLVLDTDFLLGYKLDKELSVGVGIVWRETLGRVDSAASVLNKDTHGYSFFASHTLIKNIFLYAEFSSLQNRPLLNSERSHLTTWQYQVFAGVGRKFNLLKWAEMDIMFLYDFNHRNNDLHPRPYVIKVGYRVTGKLFGRKNR